MKGKINKLIATLIITIIVFMQINKRIDLDRLQIITVVVLVYGCMYAFLEYIKKRKGNQNWWKIGYLLFFVALLIFPILRIDNNEKDLVENRNLAKKSQLFHGNKLNLNFGKETEQWLNDHFYKRKEVIGLYDKLNKKISADRIENEQAFMGQEGWLFYKGDNTIANYQNRNLYTEAELKKISDKLQNRHDWLEKQGIKYYIFVAPDKNKIYGEYYPSMIRKLNETGRAYQLREYTKGKNIEIIYPYEELISQKKDNLLYWKTDTHWNDLGGFIGYQSLLKRIKKDFNDIKILELEDFNIYYNEYGGDLLSMLSLNKDDYKDIKYPVLVQKENPNYIFIKNDGVKGVETKGEKPLKVLVFRDSYTNAMTPYISQTFGEVTYIWSHRVNDFQDEIIKQKPDIVIHEMVERYINTLAEDTQELKEVK